MTRSEARQRAAARALADLVLEQEGELVDVAAGEQLSCVEVEPTRWQQMLELARELRGHKPRRRQGATQPKETV